MGNRRIAIMLKVLGLIEGISSFTIDLALNTFIIGSTEIDTV